MPKRDDGDGWFYGLGLLLLGGIAAGTYFSSRGSTVAGSVASLTPPDTFVNLSEVENRFGEVIELYRMGYMKPIDAKSEAAVLSAYAKALKAENPVLSATLVEKIAAFVAEVEEYEKTAAGLV